ncbi:tyrosine-type recombinase/integrase [Pseudomonas sp. PDM20]|uniref:tyrosine-type recombinase/integrase n=1 Tax=Pseudomonas sp. PDM20 TaxID=2769254 RepID=UPI00177F1219|nr:tyrosine-type recombinase/integrase [Pseudomonas sp. PDM20]MBD9681440.1 tyrosine-type recombinase/integrase [Pseudomonas sp. PDM20]
MAKKHERDYLYQKAGESTWYVKIKIPVDVRPHFGNRVTLTKTTGTASKTEAMVVRLPILAAWNKQIEEARQGKLENADVWREALQSEAKRLEHSLTRNVMSEVSGKRKLYTKEEAEKLMSEMSSFMNEMVNSFKEAGADPELVDSIPILVREKLLATGHEAIIKTQKLNSILRETALQHTANRYQLSVSEKDEAAEILADPKSYRPRSPITKSMLDQWSKHLETQINTQKTRDTHRSRIERLSGWLTKEGKKLDFDSVHNFIESVSTSRSTRQNYLWSGRDFWNWACKYHSTFRDQFSGKPCPFDGHALPKAGKSAKESYTPFTKSQVESLYASAIEAEHHELADLIAFGAYTGARLEEIGRITKGNTIFNSSGDPTAFKIEQSKTEAGVREVPIHSKLLPLYKSLLENSDTNGGYLFKGGKNKYGNRLDYLSKQFGRLKTATGYDALHVFHSIRKTTITELHTSGVTLEVLPWIVGHEAAKAFTLDVYSSGPSLAQKSKAIEKLKFIFNKKIQNSSTPIKHMA